MAIITGGAAGLGYQTALALAQSCVDVIMAGPNEALGREALRALRPQAPNALVRFELLDLANLESIAAFVRRLNAENHTIDLLINNSGLFAVPERRVTADGFEQQFAINYLGHFALTGQLLPLIRRSRWPRVVHVSSKGHRYGDIRFDNLQGETEYKPWTAYLQSKLAVLMFAFELQRRSDANGWGLLSTAVHPGYARTDFIANGAGQNSAVARLNSWVGKYVSHSAAEAARSAVFAATSDAAKPGGFYGPGGFLELAGAPAAAFVAKKALDVEVARRLWEASERLTGVTWPVASMRESSGIVKAPW